MGITTVLFDLDGTLLPMDQDKFVQTYLGMLVKKVAPYGFDPKQIVDAIWQGTAEMVKNDGSRSNETVFWGEFEKIFGENARENEKIFQEFYENDFNLAKSSCGFNEKAKQVVRQIKKKGLRVALATNPLFPKIATRFRIEWAGITPEDFEIYTTYEDTYHTKPNPDYYLEVANRLGVKPEECLMVGNDVGEDMVAEKVGMKVFLLTDCLINKNNDDISKYPNGDFDKLSEYIENI